MSRCGRSSAANYAAARISSAGASSPSAPDINTTPPSGGSGNSEHRGIAELTGRYPLPGHFVLVDRNRGDFRFVSGQAYSSRYRNRLWLERDVKFERIVVTPYVFDEVYYDTRYSGWTTNRAALGAQFPSGPHLVLEPYVMRQHSTTSTPRIIHTVGFKFNLYF
jgi:Protein of unknown function (DUF2490)